MKKIGLFLFLIVFAGCAKALPQQDFHDYVNGLMDIQQNAVETLTSYYSSLESGYNGMNLELLYSGAVTELQVLYDVAQSANVWEGDDGLKSAIVSYISGLQESFVRNESPVVDILTHFSGNVADFYRENKQIFSTYAMHFAQDLAQLDKRLDTESDFFISHYPEYSSSKKK